MYPVSVQYVTRVLVTVHQGRVILKLATVSVRRDTTTVTVLIVSHCELVFIMVQIF